MADETFTFELVSPERILMSKRVYEVLAPGAEGEFGVLAGHRSLLAALKPGVVQVFESKDAKPERIFVAGGFADVSAGHMTLLAEDAAQVDDIEVAKVNADLEALDARIAAANDSETPLLAKRREALLAKRAAAA